MADEKKNNIRALKPFRLRVEKKDDEGNTVVSNRHVAKGEIVAKGSFREKSDWTNLCNMIPPRAEETSEKVGKPTKAKKAEMPGAN